MPLEESRVSFTQNDSVLIKPEENFDHNYNLTNNTSLLNLKHQLINTNIN
jgi:hypothetical protein